MTAPASLHWLAARRLGATLVALWCCAAAAQPVPAADPATRAAQAGAGTAGAASAAAVASATIAPAAVAAAAAPAPTPSCTADGGPAGRPPVGLVLSGGGARGYAHLGVLKVLEDNRIPIDCIAATSMGAVVGGLYASGMAADEMRKRLSEVNLTDIAFDVTDRADLPQSSREDERLYINSLTLGFGKKGVKAPVGLVQGNRLQALLADWTAAVPTNQPFDRLPIPYRAVATDLQTGQMVVLDRGSLPLAIR
ncbi:TPA: patatin-like phospholipase family protein, partial [Burkholderia vietnamiensis]|nr:patatin-like phospholipase family protein [Burkholderia vietnamiensis]